MFYSYLKYAWRNIIKNKSGSILNVVGLTIAITSFLLIFQYVSFEKKYDDFHSNIDRLYRVNIGMTNSQSSELEFRATNHPATGIYLLQDIPAVESMTRMVDVALLNGSSVLSFNSGGIKKSFYEKNMFYADSSFFTIFGFKLLQGDPATVLTDQNSIVLSQSTSKKFFGEANPMGQTMSFNEYAKYTVAGIMEDSPSNSHIKVNALLSASGFSEGLNNTWIWPEFYTYLKLAPDANTEQLARELDSFVERYLGDIMEQFGIEEKMTLQPVREIHLSGNLSKELKANNNKKTINFILLIGIMILVVAWINYINLSISKSIDRQKEIGVKKVIGASKKNIIIQFLFEGAIINTLAIVLAICILTMARPYLVGFTNIPAFHENWLALSLTEGRDLVKFLGILLVGTLLTAFYPATKLASFKPIETIQSQGPQRSKAFSLQNILVVSQFVIGLLMISGTMIVFKQLKFMQSQELGFQMEERLVLKAPTIKDSTYDHKIKQLRDRLVQNATIEYFTKSSDIPGHLIQNNNSVRRIDQNEAESIFATYLAVDPLFVPTYDLKILAGRNFRNDDSSDQNSVILNEKALEMLGIIQPDKMIGQNIRLKQNQRWVVNKIVGVIKDFKHRSLQFPTEPFILFNRETVPYDFITLGVHTSDMRHTISNIQAIFSEIFPKNPFEFFFLDDYFQSQYETQQQLGVIVGLFTVLAILVACLGLIGLVAHMVVRRAKEAGIRKVLGATASQILTLFTKRFVTLITIASFIAIPVSYLAAQHWLQNFAFYMPLAPEQFVLPVFILLVLSTGVILWQASRVIWINPSDILRDE